MKYNFDQKSFTTAREIPDNVGNKYTELSILGGIAKSVKFNKRCDGLLNYDLLDVSNLIDRAKIIAGGLMNSLGWSLESACALLGIIMCESGLDPQAYNKGEKNGTNTASGACNKNAPYGKKGSPWDYGAGLVQWTFVQRKDDLLRGVFGKPLKCSDYPIENLNIGYQTQFLVWELGTKWKGLNKCIIENKNNLQQSLADLYCGYVGGCKQSHSSMKDVDKLVSRYMGANPGSSENAHFKQRLNYAMSFLEQLKHQ